MRPAPYGPLLSLASLALCACASPADVNERLLPYVRSGDHGAAIEVLEASRDDYGKKDAVLYHLEHGMLHHYAGHPRRSNDSLEKAKRLAELHYTKSITAEASTFLANDNTRPYYGENFERALIHAFAALNYQTLGNLDEALVEIRQLNFLLRQMLVDGQDNRYRDDAFAHYLAALFFEEDRDFDEAWVAYKKALDAYESYQRLYGVPPPRTLRRDARRLAAGLGRHAEEEYERRYGSEPLVPLPDDKGQILVVHYNGRAPVKIDTFVDLGFAQGWPYVYKIDVEGEDQRKIADAARIATSVLADDVIRIAFPEYRDVPRRIHRMEVRPGDGPTIPAELVEDVGAIARQDLQDRIARIRVKAIARAAVKYALGKLAEGAARKGAKEEYGQEAGELAGALVRIGSALARTSSEVADKRAWFNVPDEIWLAQVDLEAGDSTLELVYRDRQGQVVREDVTTAHVTPGRRAFVIVRTVE